MRARNSYSIFAGLVFFALFIPSAAALAQGDACNRIKAACEQAGFVFGALKSGNGLDVDCVQPIMQDKPQRPQASRPLPPIDPRLVAACKTNNPSFGQAAAPPAQGDACNRVKAACEQAGFVFGAVKSGNGLDVDCIQPIIQNKPQPPQASRPLPPIDPQIVAACQAANPSFGMAPGAPAQGAPPPAAAESGDEYSFEDEYLWLV